jgi:hypothetical protein
MNVVAPGWVAVARETVEYNMRPWLGRRYESWLRASVRPHPIDPRGQVLVPQRMYDVFKKRRTFARVTRAELDAMAYPDLPGDGVAEANMSAVARRAMPYAALPRDQSTAVPELAAA